MARIRIREVKTTAVFSHKFQETTFDAIKREHYTHIAPLAISAKTIPGRHGYRLLAGAVLYRGDTPVALIEMRTTGDGIYNATLSEPELRLWTNHFRATEGTRHPITILFPHQSQCV